jgi:hypothetical protein
LHNLCQQLIKSNDELTKTDQLKSQLQNQQFALKKQARLDLKEIENLKSREEQNTIQWNLMMADKEADIVTLKEQIEAFNRILDHKELDLLAESEGGLLELSRDISLTTQQIKACISCGDTVAARLEDINDQLVVLTTILVGSGQEDALSSSHSFEVENADTNNGESFSDDVNSETYQEGFGHPCYLDDNEAFREVSVMREMEFDEFEDEPTIENEHDDSSGFIAAVQSKAADIQGRGRFKEQQRWGTTSIMIERDSKRAITSIIRTDNEESPAVIFTKRPEFTSQVHCEIQDNDSDNETTYCPFSAVTYHNYRPENAVDNDNLSSFNLTIENHEAIDDSTQTDPNITAVPDLNGLYDNNCNEGAKELNDYKERVNDMRLSMTRKDKELALAEEELIDVCKKLEEAKIKNDEQMSEITLLSRRIDQLQRSRETDRKITPGQPSSFIIKDLQMQIQHLEEKNCKKDSLIKKLAETIIRNPAISVYEVVDNLRKSTVKPSDRRIDFDMGTLCSFLEKRKNSVSEVTVSTSFSGRIMKTRQ